MITIKNVLKMFFLVIFIYMDSEIRKRTISVTLFVFMIITFFTIFNVFIENIFFPTSLKKALCIIKKREFYGLV